MRFFFAILSPILLGCALTSFSLKRNSTFFEYSIFFWSIGVGIGLGVTSAFVFLWLYFLGQLGPHYILLENCIVVLGLILAVFGNNFYQKNDWWLKKQFPASGEEIRFLKNTFYLLVLLALIIWFILQSFYMYPHGKGDAYAIWNLRARFLLRNLEGWREAFSYYPWSHPDYPLLISGSVYRAWKILHQETVLVPILIGGLFSFGSILVVFSSTAILKGKNQGYLAAMAMLATFSYLQLGASQLADIPLAFFILATMALFTVKDQGTGDKSYLSLLAGVTASCAAWTKNEGLLFLVVVMAVRFCIPWRHRSGRSHLNELVFFLFGVVPILSIVFFFKLHFAPPNDLFNIGTSQLVLNYLLDISRYSVIAAAYIKEIIFFGNGILLAFIAYYCFSGPDRENKIILSPSLLVLLLMLFGYFAVFLITPHDLKWHLQTLDRLLLQLWPLAVFAYFLFVAGPEP